MRANSPRGWVARAIFYSVVSVLIYSALCLLVQLFSAVTLKEGIAFRCGLLHEYQSAYFWSDFNAELDKPNRKACTAPDHDLWYRATIGECELKSLEFHTILRFAEDGRISDGKSDKVGIVVLGDSHAMGWGVNDAETFSAVLEEMTGRPVFNLAVASYGTYRELLALEKKPELLATSDTIVIAYNETDLHENLALLENPTLLSKPMSPALGQDDWGLGAMWSHVLTGTRPIRILVWHALTIPILVIAKPFSRDRTEWPVLFSRIFEKPDMFEGSTREGLDFSKHYWLINKVFTRFPWLKGRRVIVFYTNAFGLKFHNYAEVVKRPNVLGAEFVDFDLASNLYYSFDSHLTKAGHREIAQKLLPVVLPKSPSGSNQ